MIAGMTLTLHKSQVHCSGVMHWWACNSLVFAPLPAVQCCQMLVKKQPNVLLKQAQNQPNYSKLAKLQLKICDKTSSLQWK